MGMDKLIVNTSLVEVFNEHAAKQDLGSHFQQGELPESIQYAVKHGGFDKQILHFKIDNTQVRRPDKLPALVRWSLETIWPQLSSQYLQSITIIEAQHLATGSSLDEPIPPTTIFAPLLTLHGPLYCKGTCTLCTHTPLLFLSTSFPSLTSLTLRDLFFTFPHQLTTLLSSLPTLQSSASRLSY
jgi:hypothetical protein